MTRTQKNPDANRTRGPFRQLLAECVAERRALLVPGAANALSARIVADLGFDAVYVTGAGVTNMHLGLPDMGFLSLTQLAEHTAAIRDVVVLPVIVDADTGFGNALSVRHTVRTLQRAGANAIQIEDQVSPKRCGHFAGKEVISVGEMCGKISAAVDARTSEDLLLIARTDARAVESFQAAIDRASAYTDAGADITFVEAPESLDEIRRVPQLLAVPQVVNIVVGGKTPVVGAAELAAMGFAIVLYANAALQGAIRGMQNALGELKEHGRIDENSTMLVSFAERQRLVQKPECDEMEQKYAGDDPGPGPHK
jgi:2-methylisocitrate lyase-like PEP mutase family enzyme